ncbi:MAG: hypothetical protein IJS65_00110 [Clostridia bacterium]|nr:hypothetical protein [Clostridia bacterium]
MKRKYGYKRRITAFTAFGAACAAFICRAAVLSGAGVFLSGLLNLVRIFVYLTLFSAWGVSVSRRVVQTQPRAYLVSSAALMVFWLFVRELRWHFVEGAVLKRFLWYVYYIPILLIPLFGFLVSLSLGRGESCRLPDKTALLFIPPSALALFVLTNDLHGLVFVFPENAGMKGELDYGYGVLFRVIAVWCVLCLLLSFITLLRKCRIGRKSPLYLPLLPFALLLVYDLLYALRAPFVVGALGDFAVTECLLTALFFESCIRCGLIQSNTRYGELFGAARGLSLQIADESLCVRYSSPDPYPLTKEDMESALERPVELPGGRILECMRIKGGHAFRAKDVSALLSLRETLAEAREELSEREGLIKAEYEQEAELRRVAEQNRLYDLLNEKTGSQLDRIKELAGEYEKAESDREKKRILSETLVLGAYIKRRRDFVLLAEGGSAVTPDSLERAFDESFRSLSACGVRGAYLIDADAALTGEALTLAYDFFESVAEALLGAARYIVVNVGRADGEAFCRITSDGVCPSPPVASLYPRVRTLSGEDGGALFILPLEGGESL